jgi:seryl-tRNA synthetase
LAGFGHCFRTEAGAAGLTSKGLYRLHQFTKVEMFVATAPEKSEQMHSELLAFVMRFCADLGLNWRALDMPTLELGASAYRKYDVEVWMPGSRRWGEVASITNCTDYQSRRLDIRMAASSSNNSAATTRFAHTLNGTACAVPRILLALLETHYDAEKDQVQLPDVVAEVAGFTHLW